MTSPASQSHSNLISEAIAKLRSCSQVNIQSQWLCKQDEIAIADVAGSDFCDWTPAQLNTKGHIAWAGGQKLLWIAQKLVIPQDLQGYSLQGLALRLGLTWWADSAQVYVNGELVQEGDLFDCSPRVLLSPAVTPGEEIIVALRLVSPGHCDGALVRSLLIYESSDDKCPEPGFVADELAVMQRYLESFAPEMLQVLAGVVAKWEETNHRDTENTEEEKKEGKISLSSLRQNLMENNHLRSLAVRFAPTSAVDSSKACANIWGSKSQIYLLGHAHLDLAWLWPVSETWQAAIHTFESALKLQQEFPNLIFCHSSPVLYAWLEENRPDLFAAVQEQVAAGRWEVVGGFWVEPDLNLIAGESIVRQLLYGQRYVLEKFGKLSPVVWVPDSFGFCATLPQLMALGGVEYFVTQKLRWNDTTKFPYGAFWWRSPDGTELFSFMSALIGEAIDPVKMASYACEWQTQTGIAEALWLPGVGDHGGGPTRDMLEVAQRWQNSPFFPQLEFTTAEKYLQEIQQKASNSSSLPVWDDELYLEFHRGCYTTHADQKRWNRRCENLLYQAELFASLATISCGANYPKAEIETAWKKVLFNQFHDILPGSSITQVYVDALADWQEAEQLGTQILQQSLSNLTSQITLPEPPQPNSLPVVVFNSLNWQRSQVVAVSLPTPAPNQECQIYDLYGQKLVSQLSESSTVLFLAADIPPVGYRVFWLTCTTSPTPEASPVYSPDLVLENEFLRVAVDPETGDLSSVFDKTNQREVLSGAGNQLQAFQDSGQYWDAWNIDPNYTQHPLAPTQLKSIQWREQGQVQSCLRVIRQLNQSEFCQDYILEVGSPILKIATTVNWQESHVLVKAAFPLNLEADFATYEIPCGAIRRPTKSENPAEQAKWEVPALRWADISVDDYGVSLLNDCKYGYDSQTNQLRLTLLRSPSWPDPQADRGLHEFTYALYPHADTWQSAETVRRGYELNLPLQVMVSPPVPADSPNLTPTSSLLVERGVDGVSFLDLSAENLILMAFKQAEDNPQQWILRCYECHGETAQLSLQSDLGLSMGESVDLLERTLSNPEFLTSRQNLTIQPWKIINVKVTPSLGESSR